MAPGFDPYRTLGLARDATTDEIRRAYRRLAKANHPDSAGEAALPRFLAIQAAYEALVGPEAGRRPLGRPTGGPSSREPWRADPDRARSTREASNRRSGRRPGSRPGGFEAPGSQRQAGAAAGDAGAGRQAGETRARPGAAPRNRAERKRPVNKATPGSTTYDAAEDEPFEPEWSGGTWYGASSGTYWTINPKEYADPRKHGPEYQRRARRRLDGTPGIDRDGADDATDPDTSARSGAPAGPETPPPSTSWSASASRGDATAEAASSPGAASISGSPPAAPSPSDPLRAAQLALPGGFAGRLAIALLGWPPLGVGLATAAGEVTGCSRFAAGCLELFGVGTWLGQLAIIAILLALPSLAAISAVGTVAALAASVPTSVFLSATGGSRQPEAAGAILAVVLAVAYLGGVLFAVARRSGFGRVP